MFFLRRAQLLFISTTDERRDTTAVCDATTQIVKIVINWKKLKFYPFEKRVANCNERKENQKFKIPDCLSALTRFKLKIFFFILSISC